MGDEPPTRPDGPVSTRATPGEPVEVQAGSPPAGWDGPTLTAPLKKLHGCDDPDRMPKRDTVVVMHEAEDIRRALVRVLSIVLPGFKVDTSASPDEVVTKLAGDVGAKAALVLAEIDDIARNEAILELFYASSGRAGFQGVPFVALSQNLPMALGKGSITDAQLDRLGIDSVLEIPHLERLRAVVSMAIMKRLAIFGKIEEAKRREIMVAFFEYYIALVSAWMESLQEVSFYPEDSEDLTASDSKESVLVDIMVTLRKLYDQLIEWRALPDGDVDGTRRLSHDIGNSLAIPMANLAWLTGDRCKVGPSDKNILRIMLDEISFFDAYKEAVGQARKGQRTWSSITTEGLMLSPAQALEFPAGTVFCVIDDSQGVLNTCRGEIERQGGVVHTAKSRLEFVQLLTGDALPENVVFLVDNDLGKFDGPDSTVYGHGLIGAIKAAFPKAVIICHTSDAVDINAKPDNDYRKAGVEVVGKREWGALTRILRFSLK